MMANQEKTKLDQEVEAMTGLWRLWIAAEGNRDDIEEGAIPDLVGLLKLLRSHFHLSFPL